MTTVDTNTFAHRSRAIDVETGPSSQPTMEISPHLIRVIVFMGGLSSIGIELSAARLIAPYFGESTFIWANLIGLTLAFLAIGYWIGGRVADRYPRPWILFTVTGVAAVAAGLVPLMSRPILRLSLDAFNNVSIGAFYGSLVAVLLMIAIPVTLLGFVTPYAIRLRIDAVDRVGHTAGGIYALSTVGSIVGSFIPVLVLIPLFGTSRTFLILALGLLAPSVVALMVLRSWVPAGVSAALGVGLVAVALTTTPGGIRPTEFGELVYESESSFHYIQVFEHNGRTLLALNEGHAVHSIYDPESLYTRGPWDYFMVGPLVRPDVGVESVESALLIGLAGGTSARQITAAYGPIPIDGVEIDAEVARVGREYFHMEREAPGLSVHIADGRYFLKKSDDAYDLIVVDAFRQPYIPFQLTTAEFFTEVADHLTDDGVAVINVGRTEQDYRLVDAIASTMRAVFPYVYAIDTDWYLNTILIGSFTADGVTNFENNTAQLAWDSPLRAIGELTLATGNLREIDPGGRVFTDDHAPVEFVVDQIIIDEARLREDQMRMRERERMDQP